MSIDFEQVLIMKYVVVAAFYRNHCLSRKDEVVMSSGHWSLSVDMETGPSRKIELAQTYHAFTRDSCPTSKSTFGHLIISKDPYTYLLSLRNVLTYSRAFQTTWVCSAQRSRRREIFLNQDRYCHVVSVAPIPGWFPPNDFPHWINYPAQLTLYWWKL